MSLLFQIGDTVKIVLGTHQGKSGVVRQHMRTELGRRYYTVLLSDGTVTVFGEQELERVEHYLSQPTDDPIREAIDRALTDWASSLDPSSVG